MKAKEHQTEGTVNNRDTESRDTNATLRTTQDGTRQKQKGQSIIENPEIQANKKHNTEN